MIVELPIVQTLVLLIGGLIVAIILIYVVISGKEEGEKGAGGRSE